jgi:hypothetical protein
MIRFIKKIKDLFALSNRMENLEHELKEFDARVQNLIDDGILQAEKKIQALSFAYTKNLDDVKSDYLKRYLEVRLNCMQQELSSIPMRLSSMQHDILKIGSQLEESLPDTDE